jgi:hypothetical protein
MAWRWERILRAGLPTGLFFRAWHTARDGCPYFCAGCATAPPDIKADPILANFVDHLLDPQITHNRIGLGQQQGNPQRQNDIGGRHLGSGLLVEILPGRRQGGQIGDMADQDQLRGLKPMDRLKTILGAARDGDDSMASAVLHAPSLLSGMSANELANVRRTWASLRYPDDLARLETWEKARVHLDRAAALTLEYSFSVGDRRVVEKAKATAARAAEAIEAANANRPLLN